MALSEIDLERVKELFHPSELAPYEVTDDVLLSVVTETCNKVISYVNASPIGLPRIKLNLRFIPDETHSACLSLIRYTVLANLPGVEIANITTGAPRSSEYTEAMDYLEGIAKGTIYLDYEATEGITEEGTSIRVGGWKRNDWEGI